MARHGAAASEDGLPDCTAFRLRMAARRASRIYDHHLAAVGVGIAQFGLLMMIRANENASVTRLAERLEMDRTTLTRNLGPLVRLRLVRITAGADRRSRAVALTAEGGETLRKAVPLWRAAQAAVRARVGAPETDELHRVLAAAIARLRPES